jgi:hypothetical protein
MRTEVKVKVEGQVMCGVCEIFEIGKALRHPSPDFPVTSVSFHLHHWQQNVRLGGKL